MIKHISQISEQAFLLDFGSEINIDINTNVNLFAKEILNDSNKINLLKIKNCVPSYNKILIQFDPLLSNKSKLVDYLRSIKIKNKQKKNIKNIIEIPICYDGNFALDLEFISKKTNLSKNDIIKEHLNTLFHVYMIGFIPGLPFMGNMNNNFSLSRKITPRIKIPKGSVGIVDKLCVIYPQDSPGGWNILGRSPINSFYDNKKDLFLINSGDKIKFKRISIVEFNDYSK